jgi:DNA polymerase-3 subunit epsilon
MRQIFLDTETTGLSADQGDRVIEIGCIAMMDRRYSEAGDARFHRYVNPQRSSHPDALRVHGITDEFLADKPLFADVAADLLAFIDGAEIIIHNAAFDLGFLDAELKRLGLPPLRQHAARVTDSLLMAREMFPGKSNSLDALCKRLEVDNSGRELHGALLDAGLLAEVYIRMTRGQDALVVEPHDEHERHLDLPVIDLATFMLPQLHASDEEVLMHDALLAEVDKASSGRSIWRPAVVAYSAADQMAR